ncbi:PDR/VanB family oxidoreductase [Amycolatopsis thermoflava]|uniref:Ferredoxin-NADP reductase n=1 Tax=Amycolatopsis thermoflava TaxID=84480 RepID=A0A3N2GPC4_9PSEU|nr:PDR/VanB family oxidoreductase [Amycolatopsis thermoflava]ROS38441.1 ferredoxin-NADP reductase [Amycolatopsis thermoflava]
MTVDALTRAELELETVIERRDTIADGVVELTLRHPDRAPMPSWEAGAHIDLVLGNGLVRQYSLCGSPADRETLRVAVLREPASRGGSSYVHDELTAGNHVRIRGPRNSFALVDAPRYLFIAGGIGITPIVPMLEAASARGAKWRLVYGGRTRKSMAFRTELAERYGDLVSVCPQDEVGLLDLAGLLGEADPETAIYCCGPEPLLAAVEAASAHWPRGALHVERFAPRPDADAGERTEFEVELTQTGQTITVRADQSILEAVEAAGVFVPSSCQEGTCGTCETAVLEGIPDHRDSVLSDDEREMNDAMMICVSRCRGSRLVLDL